MDAVSYAHSAKQAQRIEKFIENPDSTSGIVTVPKTIATGETVTVPVGRVAVLPNVVVDGTLNIDGEVFIPSGSSVDFSNGIKIDGNNIALSIPTSYHLLQGNLSVSNEVITNGFSTTLYTGNGTTQSINTGIDMATQWGDDASETFGGLSWIKGRNNPTSHQFVDTVRGATKAVLSDTTGAETTDANRLNLFNNNGFTIGSNTGVNANLATYTSWNFQTTHRRTGITNHGKAFTEHYNPFTGFIIIKYEGSGLSGHEIPHHLGRKLGFVTIKNLSAIASWETSYSDDGLLYLDKTDAFVPTIGRYKNTESYISLNIVSTQANFLTNQYIMYGWANSYLDEADKLIGNYEVRVYPGTGAAGNKVTTRGKPAWIMVKRIDSTGNWHILDNKRNEYSGVYDGILFPNVSAIESVGSDIITFNANGFTLNTGAGVDINASGGQYLYMVVYDNDSGSGKSKYPRATDTSNVQINNALIPLAHGVDSNGSKNSIVVANETITGLTYTAGKNYVYAKNDGTYGVKAIAPSYGKDNPLTGDFYNILTNKWYSNTNTEIVESRNYLNHIVHADQNGQVTYVEELPKIEYKNVIKANEYQGKNACTAWAKYDITTTPPTFKEGFNAGALVRITTGEYDFYTETPYDTLNACPTVGFKRSVSSVANSNYIFQTSLNKFHATHLENGVVQNGEEITIHIFGGKN